eukprot:m.307754 g.307754  ORF g.307754 m.307754 type:complete len:715 (-) comp16367_c0_seq2:2645-4789(-)
MRRVVLRLRLLVVKLEDFHRKVVVLHPNEADHGGPDLAAVPAPHVVGARLDVLAAQHSRGFAAPPLHVDHQHPLASSKPVEHRVVRWDWKDVVLELVHHPTALVGHRHLQKPAVDPPGHHAGVEEEVGLGAAEDVLAHHLHLERDNPIHHPLVGLGVDRLRAKRHALVRVHLGLDRVEELDHHRPARVHPNHLAGGVAFALVRVLAQHLLPRGERGVLAEDHTRRADLVGHPVLLNLARRGAVLVRVDPDASRVVPPVLPPPHQRGRKPFPRVWSAGAAAVLFAERERLGVGVLCPARGGSSSTRRGGCCTDQVVQRPAVPLQGGSTVDPVGRPELSGGGGGVLRRKRQRRGRRGLLSRDPEPSSIVPRHGQIGFGQRASHAQGARCSSKRRAGVWGRRGPRCGCVRGVQRCAPAVAVSIVIPRLGVGLGLLPHLGGRGQHAPANLHELLREKRRGGAGHARHLDLGVDHSSDRSCEVGTVAHVHRRHNHRIAHAEVPDRLGERHHVSVQDVGGVTVAKLDRGGPADRSHHPAEVEEGASFRAGHHVHACGQPGPGRVLSLRTLPRPALPAGRRVGRPVRVERIAVELVALLVGQPSPSPPGLAGLGPERGLLFGGARGAERQRERPVVQLGLHLGKLGQRRRGRGDLGAEGLSRGGARFDQGVGVGRGAVVGVAAREHLFVNEEHVLQRRVVRLEVGGLWKHVHKLRLRRRRG